MSRKPHEHIVDADEAIRQYYEDGVPSETEAFRDVNEPVSPAAARAGKPERADEQTSRLSGGDIDVSSQGVDAGTEAPGGSNPSPDQDIVEEIGRAVGVTYQDNEPLKFGDKAADRDRARWELNPASSEDYEERRAREREATEQAPKRAAPPAPRKQTSGRSKRPRSKRSTS